MEGIPRVPMFALELLCPEKPLPPSFVDSIKEYIVMNYQDDPSKFNHAFTEIESMRNVVMQNVANVEAICVLKRYFAQLSMMKARFPMEENDPLAMPFSWIDRSLDLSTCITYNDINFELCCVMFNIGVSHAIIAANETRSDADSIKNAFMHFQNASWPMQHLRDSMRCGNFGGMNFTEPFLTFYSDMFLAQAQECILEKSMIDGRKPLVIAKVALQLKTYYESNMSYLNDFVTELMSICRYKPLLRLCAAKLELYDALGSYYLGVQAENEKNMGLRLSYFTYALDRIKVAIKIAAKDEREGLKQAIQYAYDVIFQREENARKENDFIYYAKITKPEDLEKIDGVVMVKPIGFDVHDISICGEDLFASLLPTDVLKTVSMYSEEKAKFQRGVVERVEAKDSELESYLISLQLNQLHLHEPIESVRLPDELLSSSAAFSAQPNAFPDLMDKFGDVMTMASEAEQKLSRLADRIKCIDNSEYSKDEGYKAISSKVEELTSHHVKARENNAELQRAVAAHSENLKLLAMPLTQLTKQICGDYIDPMDHPEGIQMRKILDKVDEMRRQRFQLLQTFVDDLAADDITKKALANRDFHPQELFETELKKHVKTVNLIDQNMVAQENILSALTEANANFSEFRQHIVELNEKRALHSLTLVTAYQVFVDVVDKTEKALAFYKELTAMIGALDKGVAIIEEMEDKRRKDAERIEAEKRAAMESANALQEFSMPSANFSATSGQMNHAGTNLSSSNLGVLPREIKSGTNSKLGGRPRLGDYLDFYKNKMAGVSQSGNTPVSHSSISTHVAPNTANTQQHSPNLPQSFNPPISSVPSFTNAPNSSGHFQPLNSAYNGQPNQQLQQQQQYYQNMIGNLPMQPFSAASSTPQPSSAALTPVPQMQNTVPGSQVQQQLPRAPQSWTPTSTPLQTPSTQFQMRQQGSLMCSPANVPQRAEPYPQPQFHQMQQNIAPGQQLQSANIAPGQQLQFANIAPGQQLQSSRPLTGTSNSSGTRPLQSPFTQQNVIAGQQFQPIMPLAGSATPHQPQHQSSNIAYQYPQPQFTQMQHNVLAKPQIQSTAASPAVISTNSSQQQHYQMPQLAASASPYPQSQFSHQNFMVGQQGQSVRPIAGNIASSTTPLSIHQQNSATGQQVQSVGPVAGNIASSTTPLSIYQQNSAAGQQVQSVMPLPTTLHQQQFQPSQFISGALPGQQLQPKASLSGANASLINPHSQISHQNVTAGPQLQSIVSTTGVSATQSQQPHLAHFATPSMQQPPITQTQQFRYAAPSTGASITTTSLQQQAPNFVPATTDTAVISQLHLTSSNTTGTTEAQQREFAAKNIFSEAQQNIPESPFQPISTPLPSLQQQQQPTQYSAAPVQPVQLIRPAATVLPVARQPSQQSDTSASVNTSVGIIISMSHPDENDSNSNSAESATHLLCRNSDPHNNSNFVNEKRCDNVIMPTASPRADAGAQPTTEKSRIESLLDSEAFELGNGDKTRLEKRRLREEFRKNGVDAQLPALDATDPLNQLDAHFWLSK